MNMEQLLAHHVDARGDRPLRQVRWVRYVKNHLAPPSEWPSWSSTNATGYSDEKPVWMSTWLFIITDNALHLGINYAALRWL